MSHEQTAFDLSSLIPELPAEFTHDRSSDLLTLEQVLSRQGLARHPHTANTPLAGIRIGSSQAFSLANGIQAAYEAVMNWRTGSQVIRLTPAYGELNDSAANFLDVPLLNGFRLPMDDLLACDPNSVLIVPTPEPISGRIATVQEIVRLCRHFSLVVLDEQLASFSLRRLTPLVDEWDNLISIQRFPFAMPGAVSPFAWIVHPPSLRPAIQEQLEPVPDETSQQVLDYGQIDTFRAERATARLKGELFRELRKLSLVSVPYPSWSPALLARLERGDRGTVLAKLVTRGIHVYAPTHPNLRQHFRVSAISSEATQALKQALIEINLEIER